MRAGLSRRNISRAITRNSVSPQSDEDEITRGLDDCRQISGASFAGRRTNPFVAVVRVVARQHSGYHVLISRHGNHGSKATLVILSPGNQ